MCWRHSTRGVGYDRTEALGPTATMPASITTRRRRVPAASPDRPDLAHLVAKTKDGVATAPVPAGPGTTMLAAHRTADGQVEVHLKLNDEFVVQSGHATVLVGGKVEGNRETAPGEWRGGAISGARSYQLGPGDVLWIPAGSPHQVTPKGGAFRYLAIKFDAK